MGTAELIEPGVVPEEHDLPPRRQAFVREYCRDLNGTQAAIRAGYSPRTANEQASELLAFPSVKAAVDRQLAQRAARIGVTQDHVLAEMAILSDATLDWFVISDEGNVTLAPGAPEGAMAAIQSIERDCTIKMDKDDNIYKTYKVKIRLWDKPNPLKLMGNHVGLFPNKVEVTGKDGGPLEVTEVKRSVVKPPGEA